MRHEPMVDGTSADPDTRARTHLANERTFLAWFRTGLTLIALGLAAGEFLTHDVAPGIPLVQALATTMILTGAFFIGASVVRYHGNRRRVDRAEFVPAGLSVSLAGAAALVAAVLATVFVWLLGAR